MKLTPLPPEAGLTHIQCSGEITQQALWESDNPLEPMLGANGFGDKVFLNLDQVDYIDSAGVGWLITCHKHFRDAGGILVLHSIPIQVHQIFQLLQMHKVLNLAKDLAAARTLSEGGTHG
jgi:anti-anti-sigma factor